MCVIQEEEMCTFEIFAHVFRLCAVCFRFPENLVVCFE